MNEPKSIMLRVVGWTSVASLLVLLSAVMWMKNQSKSSDEGVDLIPWVYMFNRFDLNHDSFLCQDEFNQAMKYLQTEFFSDSWKQNLKLADITSLVPENEEVYTTIKCSYKPINLTNADKKYMKLQEQDLNNQETTALRFQMKCLQSLSTSTVKSAPVSSKYLISTFKPAFAVETGRVWWIFREGQHGSFKYDDSDDDKLKVLHALFTLFHPRPVLRTRFSPQGAVAIVRSISDDYVDVRFRIHVEYLLSESDEHSFWLSPSQFRGQIVLTANFSQVLYFHVEVPNDRSRNVEMEWKSENSELNNVDIGYIPEMKIESEDLRNGNYSSIIWNSQISEEDSEHLLRSEMYLFSQVRYHPLHKALEVANIDRLPVHSIVLWGALDDQSC